MRPCVDCGMGFGVYKGGRCFECLGRWWRGRGEPLPPASAQYDGDDCLACNGASNAPSSFVCDSCADGFSAWLQEEKERLGSAVLIVRP
jgi:hypothetical protein